MDAHKQEIIRVDRLATGGKSDGLSEKTNAKKVLEHCRNADYVPEMLPGGTRKDLKPLNVVQPDGPSFKVTDESLVEWQKWRFRVSFNAREGAVIHDIHYDGRSVMHRLSISEMTVPYADPVSLWKVKKKLKLTLFDRETHSRGNRLLTLVMVELEIAPTTFDWDATAWA